MILWLLLAVATLTSVVNVAIATAHGEVTAVARAMMSRPDRSASAARIGCMMLVLAWTMGGLWTWYAFSVGDWRWAALFWVPFVINWIGKAAQPKRPAEVPP